MRPLLRLASPARIGIELHESQIRFIRLTTALQQPKIEYAVIQDLPPGCVIEGKIKDQATIIQLLSQIVQETESQGIATAISLPAQGAMSQRLMLSPELTDEECEAEIATYLKQHFPSSQHILCFDFAKLALPEPVLDNILFVASREELRDSYAQLVTAAGLSLQVVDIDSYALVRAACYGLCDRESLPVTMIIDMGMLLVRFVGYHGGEIIFFQQWHMPEIAQDFSTELTQQVKRILQNFPQVPIQKIIMLGADAVTRRMAVLLKIHISIPIVHANPFADLAFRDQSLAEMAMQNTQRLMTCFGLVMRRHFA